jgi:hypothetical protein
LHHTKADKKPKFWPVFCRQQNREIYLNLFQHFVSILQAEKVFHASSVKYTSTASVDVMLRTSSMLTTQVSLRYSSIVTMMAHYSISAPGVLSVSPIFYLHLLILSLAFLHSSFLQSRRPSHHIALRLPLRMSSSYDGPWIARKVREEFFNYFRSKNHTLVPSSSTVPYDDLTLLFANAGMNQVHSTP